MKHRDQTLNPINLESSWKPFEFKMVDVGRLYKRKKWIWEQNCLFISHNAAVKRLGKKTERKAHANTNAFAFFPLHCLTTLLFFIFQEFTLKPVDLSRPEGSDIYQIPAQGIRGRLKTSDWGREQRNTESEGGERQREKAYASPLFLLMPQVKDLHRQVCE